MFSKSLVLRASPVTAGNLGAPLVWRTLRAFPLRDWQPRIFKSAPVRAPAISSDTAKLGERLRFTALRGQITWRNFLSSVLLASLLEH